MKKNEMDRTGSVIIKICIFSIVLSLTALALSAFFKKTDKIDKSVSVQSGDRPVIIVDAGHGGEDGGAISPDGTPEKDLNLSVALTLGDLLKASGYNVILTRTEDRMLYSDAERGSMKMQDLKTRCDIANSEENALFISIHMNKFSQQKYSGLQVFYSKNHVDSAKVAEIIRSNTKNMLQPENNREIKPSGSNIYLLSNIEIPAVLVECGFLSNPEECALLKTEKYQKELAAVIYASIVEFTENK